MGWKLRLFVLEILNFFFWSLFLIYYIAGQDLRKNIRLYTGGSDVDATFISGETYCSH